MLCSLYCFLQFAIIVLDSGQFLIRQFHDLHKALDGLACFDESRLMLAHNPEREAKPVATWRVSPLCWLLVASVGQNRPVRTPHPIPCFLPIAQRKSTISSIDSLIFTEGEWTLCTRFSRSFHA